MDTTRNVRREHTVYGSRVPCNVYAVPFKYCSTAALLVQQVYCTVQMYDKTTVAIRKQRSNGLGVDYPIKAINIFCTQRRVQSIPDLIPSPWPVIKMKRLVPIPRQQPRVATSFSFVSCVVHVYENKFPYRYFKNTSSFILKIKCQQEENIEIKKERT